MANTTTMNDDVIERQRTSWGDTVKGKRSGWYTVERGEAVDTKPVRSGLIRGAMRIPELGLLVGGAFL